MQFPAAPLLGELGDRFGRRPVMVVPVAGLGFDHVLLALAPNLWWLFVGRLIAGLTSANVAAATATIADVADPADKSQLFRLVGAAFGAGFVVGRTGFRARLSRSPPSPPWPPPFCCAGSWPEASRPSDGRGDDGGADPTLEGEHEGELPMSAPDDLKEVYTDELKDLWSANDQMSKALRTLVDKVHDKKLREMFEGSFGGIEKHTATLKSLVESADDAVEPEHCRGMEGLVKEALKHGLAEAPEDGDLRDLVLIAQYQRMSHYGITGFGTAAAYATALGRKDDAKQLKAIVSDIYRADEYTTTQGERLAKLAAKHAAAGKG